MKQVKQLNNYNNQNNLTSTVIPEGGLLQSKYWADVLRAEKKEVVEIGGDENKIFGVINKLPVVGKYLYVARLSDKQESKAQKEVQSRGGAKKKNSKKTYQEIITKAKEYNCFCVRIDLESEKIVEEFTKKYSIQKAPHNMQPKENFIIDIGLSEEELLAGMKSKTRYNIRLAKKKGVKILVSREQKYIDEFINLVDQTAKRKGVSFHQREHYQQMFQNIPEDILQLYVAKYEGEVVAVNIISFYGGVATYLHGATSDKHRNVMAPFLLQWQAILDAKKREIKHYDFGGIFTESADSGKQGITRFKLGFSPKTQPYQTAGSYDIVLNKLKYWMYRILQKMR
jgi:lipid II:glycine glycyltransferase (peptidoglycan interpeptide bridge formation enzyme)